MPPPRGKLESTSVVVFLLHVLSIQPSASNSGLLSSTLHTFHEASCDGEIMKMSCPTSMLISIQFAQYGRQVPSSKMCPIVHTIQGDDPGPGGRSPHINALWEDTNCLATTSLKVILDECQDKRKCHLVASTQTFQQDPCPGTRKYLEVAYKCRPDKFSSETVCEGDQLELRCSKSTRIAMSSAIFGRTTGGDPKCPELLRNTSTIKTSCQSDVVLQELMKRCHGKKMCTIEAEEYVFGNPCPNGVNKYLNVVYTCVPKRVLKQLRRHHHRKHKKKKHPAEEGRSENSSQKYPPESQSPHSINKIHHTTGRPPDKVENFPADAAQQLPADPAIGESKNRNSKDESKTDISSGKDDNSRTGKTTPCVNYTQVLEPRGPSAIGLVTDWLNTFNFVNKNIEKAILYLILGVAFGVISILFLVIIRLAIVNKRRSRAKLDISEPAHEDYPAPSNHIEAPTLERSDSVDQIEVVRFNPMRSRDFATCTLRSDVGDRSLTNYYG